jgi:hypothetical protein
MANRPPSFEHDLHDALAASVAALTRHHVRYAVVGGMAAGFRAQPRFTKDLDLLLHVPQVELPSLLESLRDSGFEFDMMATIREWTQHHMAVLHFRGIRIDWLKPVLPAYQHVLDRATEEVWLQLPIRVASAEGLILLKLLAYRLQDQVDIENLVAAHGETLDLDWIRGEWQVLAPFDDPRMVRLQELVAQRRTLRAK